MVRYTWIAHGPQIDCIVTAQEIEPVFRHHLAGFQIVLTSPWKVLKCDRERPVHLCNSRKYLFPLSDDLRADAVSCNHRDMKLFHLAPPPNVP